ncbi:MAG: hypothetical protein M3426_13960 [Actinomycetota bacterium]|nr:hypothetical protein [Actinomycetota bacterium]
MHHDHRRTSSPHAGVVRWSPDVEFELFSPDLAYVAVSGGRSAAEKGAAKYSGNERDTPSEDADLRASAVGTSETATVTTHRTAAMSELPRAPDLSARAARTRPNRAKAQSKRLVSLKIMTMNRCGVVAGTSPSSSTKNRGGRKGFGSKITWAHTSPKAAHESANTAANLFQAPCQVVSTGSSPTDRPARAAVRGARR